VDTSRESLTSAASLRKIGEADAAMAKGGANFDLLMQRAVALTLADQYALMDRDATAALKLQPESGYAHALHGIALAARKQTWPALLELRRATDIDPKIAEAWLKRGEIEGELHRPAEAVEALTKVLALHPGDPHTLKLREKNLRMLGKLAEANADAAQLKAGGAK
jgi:tetratricopeptide (TPR) repeat protein